MTRTSSKFLRHALIRNFRPASNPEPSRICYALRRCNSRRSAHTFIPKDEVEGQVEKEKRLKKLEDVGPLPSHYPRMVTYPNVPGVLAPKEAEDRYHSGELGGAEHQLEIQVLGRVQSVRLASSKLMFVDIRQAHSTIQVMCEFKSVSQSGMDPEDWKHFKNALRRGDWISVVGQPSKTRNSEFTIKATNLPLRMAPSLHHHPKEINDPETLATKPHVHQLIDRVPMDIMRLRAFIYRHVRKFLDTDGFMEVETPMFDVGAGGAIARPFETVSNEMSNRPLKLRVAPELYLKRLIVGENPKIYELGKVFRNEGVDHTHNPEFTICEFYETGATLDNLIRRTERLFHDLSDAIEQARETQFPTFPITKIERAPFPRLQFIPTIEKALNCKLPDLSSDTAGDELLALFKTHNITVPAQPTLPRLLDTLAEQYIEPLCSEPTFITHHPEALSPLSKSFLDPATNQRVAARAELFIQQREYVNCYEEENSPFEQRKKFEQQVRFHRGDDDAVIDESYIEALEWGMPPTGGWGCGMDRLVMLFAGQRRIADVLPFGTLRNLVSIAKNK